MADVMLSDEPQVSAAVLGLGSNTDAAQLTRAADRLADLGVLTQSQVISGADFTGRCGRIYHNLSVYLVLNQPTPLVQLLTDFKAIEQDLGRNPAKKTAEFDYEVAIDIDVLALNVSDLTGAVDSCWQIDDKRLPFKAHEIAGLIEVAPWLLSL